MRWIVLLVTLVAHVRSQTTCDTTTFPTAFKFGAGTSAYQIEGGWNADGKGRSWWDYFMATYSNSTNGNVADDSYHLYKEDVAAMQEMGLDFYRFSISWSRILPKGFSNEVNQAGVDYYNNLLDELELAGITPMVTMYHWDTPMVLEHLGVVWNNVKMVQYFVEYADLLFSLFGDRVKIWNTINEPKSFCQALPDYLYIYVIPEYPIGIAEYLCIHHVLLAHAKTYRLYEEKYKAAQKGKIAIVLDLNHNIPLTNSTADEEATNRKNTFDYDWIAYPLVYGDYPQLLKDIVANHSALQNFSASRLPKFSCTEKLILQGAYDFFAVNTYTAYYVTGAQYNNSPSSLNDEQVTTSQNTSWGLTAVDNLKVYPEGIREILNYVSDKYGNPEIMITENGYSDATGTLNDTLRIEFIRDTLEEVRLAMCDGVNVTYYSYWSLLDNLEWVRGYRVKFGLVQVDFESENRTRTLKNSAYYYRNVIATRNL